MGGRGATSSQPKAMTEKEYLGLKGVGDISSGYTLDKLRNNSLVTSQRGRKKFRKEIINAENEYQAKREQARKEYRDLVKQGKLRDKTRTERIIDAARGHEDNESTQAARRLAKKYGIK